jgi:hypothetical protein
MDGNYILQLQPVAVAFAIATFPLLFLAQSDTPFKTVPYLVIFLKASHYRYKY